MTKGLKFLFKRGFRIIWLDIACIVMTIGLMVLLFCFHGEMGTEDYLICKVAPHFCTMLFVMLSGIFLCTDIVGNRVMRSAPISKSMRLYSIPIYNTILPFGISAIMNLVYLAYILIAGLDIINFSDMLIISAALTGVMTIFSTIGMNFSFGMLLMIYAYIPLFAANLFISDSIWENGFGLPLWAALLIYLGVAAASSGISFVVARLFYKYGNFKPLMQQTTV